MEATEEHKITIITCILNVERYLTEAIESVLFQQYQHWELLLIDDGSTDGSTAIAKRYAAAFSDRIFYTEHPGHVNKGLSASRNVGLNKASGDYIAFLDADDVWLPGYLLAQVRILQEHRVAMVCEATDYWYSWSDPERFDVVTPIGTPAEKVYQPPQLLLKLYPLGEGAAPCVCGTLVKRDVLLRHGGFEESFTGMYEDQVFFSKLYLQERVYISSQCNNRYRQRPDSLMGTTQRRDYFQVRSRYLEWLETYLVQEQLTDQKIHQLLQKALLPYRHPQRFYLTETLPRQLKHLVKRGYKNFFQSS